MIGFFFVTRDLKLVTFKTDVVDNVTRVTYIYVIIYCISVDVFYQF
jgi:hypothetical protein